MPGLAAAALAGGATIGLVYATARRRGLTRVDLAQRLAPERPLLGRLGQLAIGSAGCLPCAATGRPRLGTLLGAALGLANGLPRRSARETLVSVTAHAAGGSVAALLATPRRRACP